MNDHKEVMYQKIEPKNTGTLFIVLSGLPCTGKSSWASSFKSEAIRYHIPVTILSSDDLAFKLCQELNHHLLPNERAYQYQDMFTTKRDLLEQHFAEQIRRTQDIPGIVILDRTYLSTTARKLALDLLLPQEVHLLQFSIHDDFLWQQNLEQRNKEQQEKIISKQVILNLQANATAAQVEEGFRSIIKCTIPGEENWQAKFTETQNSLIRHYLLHYRETLDELHCHLNGSVSMSFLQERAKVNHCEEHYIALEELKKEYGEATIKQPAQGYEQSVINKIWQQFSLVHKIIQTPTDITLGTLDVIKRTEASYIEIRTTPKKLAKHTLEDYVEAFAQGIQEARSLYLDKQAMGLISLDRTIHNHDDVDHFIQLAMQTPEIIGIDICGNPEALRTLTGIHLFRTIFDVLNNGLCLAIHMGETNSKAEQDDCEIILNALEIWSSQQKQSKGNPLHGRVRLGHCIYLTPEHQKKIQKLQLPIEVCPSCHLQLNWHLQDKPHPVTEIYHNFNDPVVVGTDDELIFGASLMHESMRMYGFFNHNNQSETNCNTKSKFRFLN
ncbi:MAG: AAA family ATPase [Legionella sp.]|nr:AAA family ATPase [Legionella sp.]